jgi:hypothetical protein
MPRQYVYQKVSMEMHTRSVHNGLVSALKATVFYTSEGKMASLYSEPQPLLVTNNAKGEVMVYDFRKNSVTQKQNFMMSTEANQLFFFLENNKSDLGLAKMGFALHQTRFEDGLRITVWYPPVQLAKDIQKVELAHEQSNPVFLGYFDKRGRAISKVFFYDYQSVAGLQFPTAVTQITYTAATDSVISKTQYSNFKTDREVDDQYLNFKVPTNAKVNN